jgi:hypothetical protein
MQKCSMELRFLTCCMICRQRDAHSLCVQQKGKGLSVCQHMRLLAAKEVEGHKGIQLLLNKNKACSPEFSHLLLELQKHTTLLA